MTNQELYHQKRKQSIFRELEYYDIGFGKEELAELLNEYISITEGLKGFCRT